MVKRLAFILSLLTFPAYAQQPPPPEIANFSLILQQLMPAAQMYARHMQETLDKKEARIVELEKLCGEPCKKAEK